MIKRNIRIKESLIFYDYPQVFVGEDQLGAEYIGYLVDEKRLQFICSLLSKSEIQAFRYGEKSLREVITGSQLSEHYVLEVRDFQGGFNEVLELKYEIEEISLPSNSLRLRSFQAEEDRVLSKANERNLTVIEVALEAPEADTRLQIDSDRLKDFLAAFGSFVRQAYKRALRDLSQESRGAIDITDGSKMHIVGFARGSFLLEIESAKEADLFGHTELPRAFSLIDKITSETEDPERALAIIQDFKGHFAGSYGKFLEFMVKNKTGIRYQWAYPHQNSSSFRHIRYNSVSRILELMNRSEQIGIETVTLTGRIQKADSETGAWRIESEEDGKPYSGTVEASSGVSVEGVTIKSKRYRLICEERIEEIVGSGREKSVLYLTAIEEL